MSKETHLMGMVERILLLHLEQKWMDEVPRAFSDMKERMYTCCVRSSMIYGSETIPLLADVGLNFERTEMQVIRWMRGVSIKH